MILHGRLPDVRASPTVASMASRQTSGVQVDVLARLQEIVAFAPSAAHSRRRLIGAVACVRGGSRRADGGDGGGALDEQRGVRLAGPRRSGRSSGRNRGNARAAWRAAPSAERNGTPGRPPRSGCRRVSLKLSITGCGVLVAGAVDDVQLHGRRDDSRPKSISKAEPRRQDAWRAARPAAVAAAVAGRKSRRGTGGRYRCRRPRPISLSWS